MVGPRLRNPDGTLQRSVRGFPTLWRLATEYFFLRKLAPRSDALNAFYAGGFDHDEVREADFLGALATAARRAGRSFAVGGVHGAAPDHPIRLGFPEGRYLKFVDGRAD